MAASSAPHSSDIVVLIHIITWKYIWVFVLYKCSLSVSLRVVMQADCRAGKCCRVVLQGGGGIMLHARLQGMRLQRPMIHAPWSGGGAVGRGAVKYEMKYIEFED